MAIPGFYFTTNMLQRMGQPRKKGLFGKEVIDALLLDSVIDQMIDWAAAIGAGRPEIALRLIAHIFSDRDWSAATAPNIAMFIIQARQDREAKITNKESLAPHKVVEHISFSEHFGEFIDTNRFADKEIRGILEQLFLFGLIHGLGNPSEYEIWYESHRKEMLDSLPKLQSADLQVQLPSTLDDHYRQSEGIVRDYENQFDHLPEIPAKLLLDIERPGLRI